MQKLYLEFWGRKGGSLPQSNIYVQFSEKLLVILGGGASVFSQILVVFSHCYVLQKIEVFDDKIFR